MQGEQEELQSQCGHEPRLPSGHRVVRRTGIDKRLLLKNETIRLPFHVLYWATRLLNVLEVIAPFKHFNKLREFVQMKLPPGFPVKLGRRDGTTPSTPAASESVSECAPSTR